MEALRGKLEAVEATAADREVLAQVEGKLASFAQVEALQEAVAKLQSLVPTKAAQRDVDTVRGDVEGIKEDLDAKASSPRGNQSLEPRNSARFRSFGLVLCRGAPALPQK